MPPGEEREEEADGPIRNTGRWAKGGRGAKKGKGFEKTKPTCQAARGHARPNPEPRTRTRTYNPNLRTRTLTLNPFGFFPFSVFALRDLGGLSILCPMSAAPAPALGELAPRTVGLQGQLAYDALRVFVNCQRERRLNKVRERKQAARKATGLLAAGGLRIVDEGQSLAIRVDGSVACWGDNVDGRAPPAGVPGNFVAIAAGFTHSLALRRDGSVACWGRNREGQAPPDGVSGPFRVTQAEL